MRRRTPDIEQCATDRADSHDRGQQAISPHVCTEDADRHGRDEDRKIESEGADEEEHRENRQQIRPVRHVAKPFVQSAPAAPSPALAVKLPGGTLDHALDRFGERGTDDSLLQIDDEECGIRVKHRHRHSQTFQPDGGRCDQLSVSRSRRGITASSLSCSPRDSRRSIVRVSQSCRTARPSANQLRQWSASDNSV